MITIRRSDERGRADHGWLKSRHTFSFADYHDREWMGFRSLRVINDDVVMPGRGFGTHPHRDMEIVTYILDGELEHRDSMGNGRVIRKGEVQYMAAGSGVTHSEFNPSKDREVHLLQIWIVPDEKGVPPGYAERSFAGAADGTLTLIASGSGRDSSIRIHQDADLWLGKLAAGIRINHSVAENRHIWLHVAEGEVEVAGEILKSGDAMAINDEGSVDIAGLASSQILLFDLS